MYIAKEKRKENIAEYILYLWQIEDLLRALQFSPEAIYSQLVAKQEGLNEEQKQTLFFWYMEIVNLLRSEGKSEHGHLEHTLHLIHELNDLHLQLLQFPIGVNYRNLFAALEPELPRLREVLGNPTMSDIELCFRALYAVVLYRIKGDEAHKAHIEDVITFISPVVALLSKMHGQVERGEVDLFRGVD